MSTSNGYCKPEELFGRPYKPRFADVTVQGRKFHLRSLNDEQYTQWQMAQYDDEGKLDIEKQGEADALLIVFVVVDAQSKSPVFTPADVAKIRQLDFRFVNELSKACFEHINGGTEDSAKNS